jgi:hypothetical protein
MDYTVELMKDFDKARIESMSNRIEELEAHLEILEKQLELYYAESKHSNRTERYLHKRIRYFQ